MHSNLKFNFNKINYINLVPGTSSKDFPSEEREEFSIQVGKQGFD
jgi:hypothetical protein